MTAWNGRQILSEILSGVKEELDLQPSWHEVEVMGCSIQDNRLKIRFKASRETNSVACDELEGTLVEWVGLPPGGITVLSAVLEYGNEHIIVEGNPLARPKVGETIRLRLPQYLKILKSRWENPTWSRTCLNWLEQFNHLEATNVFIPNLVPDSSNFAWLRQCQKEVFQLFGWNVGFIFGPPGTGKTTCSSAVIAQYLVQFPGSRILLVSNTNQAVDQSLIAVDKHLETIGHTNIAAQDIRMKCVRFGTRYNRSQYRGRTHLLADVPQDSLKPPLGGTGQPHQPINRLGTARLTAMTVNRALHALNDLQGQNYRLLVVDEASQVGLAQAAVLAPLARQVVFAGDPKQLSPIVKATTQAAQTWLGTSPFSQIDEAAEWVCFLNEQSRMAAPICNLVSELFYGGKLKVAESCLEDAAWQQERELNDVPAIGSSAVEILATKGNSLWSVRHSGMIRPNSAEIIRDLTIHLANQVRESDILVVTPFRAQERLIRELFRQAGLKQVRVSTVHRAQGSEYHTVIFDPVDGSHHFLQTLETRRLLNVAFSRAKARLVLILSKSDRSNPLLQQVIDIAQKPQEFPLLLGASSKKVWFSEKTS